ncbi:hypothetical protein [Halorubrum kocurii]|uniref:Uncharacterized protein n=1 Tax=Halorubrum kocurii JCM 14978 TaxID=1230456 RepID=M0NKJ5_9EURY|nr:hypothetical protein [Halorubrum kocurii]EMA57644.1 hypothetical protein C468_16677 [Halorubrum kocurii JCM 14978]
MTTPYSPRRLTRPYVAASALTLLLAVVAAGVGLFVPGFYRDAAVLLPQLYGQDLLTLAVAVPALAVALRSARRGSLRGYVVWLGVTGYFLYTYASYALLTTFNELYLVYVALFGLTLYTLVGGVARLDPTAVKTALDGHPVRGYVAFQALVAGLVALLWLADVGPASLAGTRPESIAGTTLPVPVIQSLDLAVVIPSFALSAAFLWKRRAWGYVFTGVLLVKGTTLGLAVLAMIAFMLRSGQPVPAPQIALFALLSVAGLALTGRFFSAISPRATATRPRADAETRLPDP